MNTDIVINVLVSCIRMNDNKAITIVRSKVIANLGYNEYVRLYDKAYLLANTRDYKFIDLDAKVYRDSADKNVCPAIELGHNED